MSRWMRTHLVWVRVRVRVKVRLRVRVQVRVWVRVIGRCHPGGCAAGLQIVRHLELPLIVLELPAHEAQLLAQVLLQEAQLLAQVLLHQLLGQLGTELALLVDLALWVGL